jgi:hypothetical protein
MLMQCRLFARIGSGGRGDVSKAIDTRLRRELAIKVIDAEQERPAPPLAIGDGRDQPIDCARR